MKKPLKKMPLVGYTMLVFIFGLLAVFYYWSFYPYKPLEVLNSPVPIRPPTVQSGKDQVVIATLRGCKNGKAIPTVTRSLIGQGSVIMTPSYPGVLSKGCSTLDQAIIVPSFVTPGVYHWHWRVVYKVNPIRTETVQYDSQNFQITKVDSVESNQ